MLNRILLPTEVILTAYTLYNALPGSIVDMYLCCHASGSACLVQLHPQYHAHTWAIIEAFILTKTELLLWAFKRDRCFKQWRIQETGKGGSKLYRARSANILATSGAVKLGEVPS